MPNSEIRSDANSKQPGLSAAIHPNHETGKHVDLLSDFREPHIDRRQRPADRTKGDKLKVDLVLLRTHSV